MRKITEQACEAFLAGKNWKGGNMATVQRNVWTEMYLHGNLIARRDPVTGRVDGTLAGWPTPTTRERLNGLAAMIDGASVYQRRGEQWRTESAGSGYGIPLDSEEWFTIGRQS